jgi:hypothetical protein
MCPTGSPCWATCGIFLAKANDVCPVWHIQLRVLPLQIFVKFHDVIIVIVHVLVFFIAVVAPGLAIGVLPIPPRSWHLGSRRFRGHELLRVISFPGNEFVLFKFHDTVRMMSVC